MTRSVLRETFGGERERDTLSEKLDGRVDGGGWIERTNGDHWRWVSVALVRGGEERATARQGDLPGRIE